MEEVVVELNRLIDSPIEDTVTLLNDFTLGQLKSFSNGVKLKYKQVEMLKDQMLRFKGLDDTPQEDIEKANFIIENLYIALQKIEDINNVAIDLINIREMQC